MRTARTASFLIAGSVLLMASAVPANAAPYQKYKTVTCPSVQTCGLFFPKVPKQKRVYLTQINCRIAVGNPGTAPNFTLTDGNTYYDLIPRWLTGQTYHFNESLDYHVGPTKSVSVFSSTSGFGDVNIKCALFGDIVNK